MRKNPSRDCKGAAGRMNAISSDAGASASSGLETQYCRCRNDLYPLHRLLTRAARILNFSSRSDGCVSVICFAPSVFRLLPRALTSIARFALCWLLFALALQAGDVIYTYDTAGRLVLVDYGNGTAVGYRYDDSGNLLAKNILAARLELRPTTPLMFLGRTGTVNLTITFAQGKETVVALSSSNTAIATVPASVTLAAGATSVTISVTPLSAGSTTVAARLPIEIGGASASAELRITALPSAQRDYALADRGGLSLVTLGAFAAPTIGYARIQPAAGSTTPAGLAIFGLRQDGILVSETGVPASARIRSGRTFAEVSGVVNTGLALANPNSQPANVSFFFTDTDGTDVRAGTTVVAANSQIAAFLNQSPFNGSSTFLGSFTFISDQPIGVIALRGLTNERSEFLLTTLPVADLSVAVSGETVLLPHFVDGGGWTTQVVLVNTGSELISGTIEFWSQGSTSAPAESLTLTVNSVTAASFSYSIPPRGARSFQTSGEADAARAGSVRITPQTGRAPSGLGIFSFKTGGITVSEASVPALPLGKAFRMYTEISGAGGPVQTGIAIANSSNSAVTVNFELTTLAAVSTGLAGSAVVAANGQVALFVTEIAGFQSLALPFRGILRITTDSPAGVSVIGLRARTNERSELLITTTPPVSEEIAAAGEELLLPHFVDGGGYTTQFILFAHAPGQRPQGTLRFFGPSGQPLNLVLE
ncbi:MAG: RHS repeat protein [Acidobacteria bacterium]|nr:RHS repeat protein [Acidobacteriota bacterium]